MCQFRIKVRMLQRHITKEKDNHKEHGDEYVSMRAVCSACSEHGAEVSSVIESVLLKDT